MLVGRVCGETDAASWLRERRTKMLRKHSSDDGLEMMQMPYPVWDENDVVHGEVPVF
jgi:hypothetical protein